MAAYYGEIVEHIPTVFGRIHGTQDQCRAILTDMFSAVTACYEEPDSGCSRSHCHFIGATDNYKNDKSLRNALANKCKKILQTTKQYSVKEFDAKKIEECLRYICKDEKQLPDVTSPPTNIFMNQCNIPVKQLQKYRKEFYEDKNNKKRKNKVQEDKSPFWKKIYKYILEKDGEVFNKCVSTTPHKIAGYVYDYFEESERFLQNDRFIELTIKTIMIQAFTKNPETRLRLKKSMVSNWCVNFSALNYFDYNEDEESDEDSDLF